VHKNEERMEHSVYCIFQKHALRSHRSFSCRPYRRIPLPAFFPSVPSRFPAKAPWHRSHRVIITRHRVTIVVTPADGSHLRERRRSAIKEYMLDSDKYKSVLAKRRSSFCRSEVTLTMASKIKPVLKVYEIEFLFWIKRGFALNVYFYICARKNAMSLRDTISKLRLTDYLH